MEMLIQEISHSTVWIPIFWKEENVDDKTHQVQLSAREKALALLEKKKEKKSIPVSRDERIWLWLIVDILA